MKRVIFISVLLIAMISLTSCLTMLSSLLEDITLPNLFDTEPADQSEKTDTSANKNTRTEKDAYDKAAKLDCIIGGAKVSIPNYFDLTDNFSDDLRMYYAETGGKNAFLQLYSWDGENYSQAEFEADITEEKLQNMFLEGIFRLYDSYKLISTDFLEICSQKCCIFDYTAKKSGLNCDGRVFFIYIERTDRVLCITILQSENTTYTYNNDYMKIINSVKLISEQETDSHSHIYKTFQTKAPTCIDPGENTLKCTVCCHTKTEEVPATEKHTYNAVITKPATCKDTGEKTYTCSVCGNSYNEIIPVSTIHTYGDWKVTKEATTSSSGTKERVCSICGQKQTEYTPKLYPVSLPSSSLAKNATQIKKQQKITVNDYCEFTVESFNITNDVVPPKKSGVYTHYKADQGKIYIDLCIKYKNLDTGKISADSTFKSTLIYRNIYEYTGNIIVEESDRSDFTYASLTDIAPLSSIYLHILFNASDIVKSTDGSLIAVLQVNSKYYSIVIRDGKTGEIDTTQGYNAKSSGNIKINEKIAIPGKCEFYIESIKVASRIDPPKASGVYFYKKADDGNKFIDICIRYKNTREKYTMADDNISAGKLIYKTKYEYTAGGFIEEDDRSAFTYLSITKINPLCYEYIHIAYEVPDEVANNSSGLTVTLKIYGTNYTVIIP